MDKLDAAIERLRTAAEMSAHLYKKPLLLTYSGGKDSDVCLELANLAGIPFEVQHMATASKAVTRTTRQTWARAIQFTFPWMRGRPARSSSGGGRKRIYEHDAGRSDCRISRE